MASPNCRVLVADDEEPIRRLLIGEHLIETQPRMMEKTVVMTAFPKAAAKERLHHLCCILSKPFDMDELVQVVGDCARR